MTRFNDHRIISLNIKLTAPRHLNPECHIEKVLVDNKNLTIPMECSCVAVYHGIIVICSFISTSSNHRTKPCYGVMAIFHRLLASHFSVFVVPTVYGYSGEGIRLCNRTARNNTILWVIARRSNPRDIAYAHSIPFGINIRLIFQIVSRNQRIEIQLIAPVISAVPGPLVDIGIIPAIVTLDLSISGIGGAVIGFVGYGDGIARLEPVEVEVHTSVTVVLLDLFDRFLTINRHGHIITTLGCMVAGQVNGQRVIFVPSRVAGIAHVVGGQRDLILSHRLLRGLRRVDGPESGLRQDLLCLQDSGPGLHGFRRHCRGPFGLIGNSGQLSRLLVSHQADLLRGDTNDSVAALLSRPALQLQVDLLSTQKLLDLL